MRRMTLCLALPAILFACHATTDSGKRDTAGGASERDESGEDGETRIPRGAIQTGDDLYMVPVGEGSDGCVRFKSWSKSRFVSAAIYYRKADGGFTVNRSLADCGSGS